MATRLPRLQLLRPASPERGEAGGPHPDHADDSVPGASRGGGRFPPSWRDNQIGPDVTEHTASGPTDADSSFFSMLGACSLLAFLVLGVATGWIEVGVALLVGALR